MIEKNEKYKLVALFGMSSAGKDTIRERILQALPKDTHKVIACTTRPKRENEADGQDYYFLDIQTFGAKVLDMSMLEATEFREWFYGTDIESLDKEKINVGIFNYHAIPCLLEDDRLDLLLVEVEANDKVRLLRSLNRESNPDCNEIIRRFIADKKDKDEFDNEYGKLTDIHYQNNDKKFDKTLIDDIMRHFGQNSLKINI